jgi:hypothetical protein
MKVQSCSKSYIIKEIYNRVNSDPDLMRKALLCVDPDSDRSYSREPEGLPTSSRTLAPEGREVLISG